MRGTHTIPQLIVSLNALCEVVSQFVQPLIKSLKVVFASEEVKILLLGGQMRRIRQILEDLTQAKSLALWLAALLLPGLFWLWLSIW